MAIQEAKNASVPMSSPWRAISRTWSLATSISPMAPPMPMQMLTERFQT